MNLRYLNPFYIARRIRALKAEVSYERRSACDWFDAYMKAREETRQVRADGLGAVRILIETLGIAEQVIDAHMDERAELKDALDIANQAGLAVTEMFVNSDAVFAQFRTETVEGLKYLSDVERALGYGGVTVENDPTGPIVVVNQDLFLQRVAEGAFKMVREEQTEAA